MGKKKSNRRSPPATPVSKHNKSMVAPASEPPHRSVSKTGAAATRPRSNSLNTIGNQTLLDKDAAVSRYVHDTPPDVLTYADQALNVLTGSTPVRALRALMRQKEILKKVADSAQKEHQRRKNPGAQPTGAISNHLEASGSLDVVQPGDSTEVGINSIDGGQTTNSINQHDFLDEDRDAFDAGGLEEIAPMPPESIKIEPIDFPSCREWVHFSVKLCTLISLIGCIITYFQANPEDLPKEFTNFYNLLTQSPRNKALLETSSEEYESSEFPQIM